LPTCHSRQRSPTPLLNQVKIMPSSQKEPSLLLGISPLPHRRTACKSSTWLYACWRWCACGCKGPRWSQGWRATTKDLHTTKTHQDIGAPRVRSSPGSSTSRWQGLPVELRPRKGLLMELRLRIPVELWLQRHQNRHPNRPC
jgi:hypothetical protein